MDFPAALGGGMTMVFLRRAALSAVFLGLWAIYLANLSPSVGVGDSGEFITAAATLSLAHAPSYPLFALVGKAFHALVPFGNVAYRLNLMSAFFNFLSASLIFLMARRMGLSRPSAVMAALLAASAPAFFHNSLVTEVFAMNTFLALLFLNAAFLPWPRGGILSAFVFGLGLGNHQTLVLAAPAAGILLWRAWRQTYDGPVDFSLAVRLKARYAPWVLFALALGLSVYLFLPLRAPQTPPLNWGNPHDLNGVIRSFLRKDYGTMALALGDQPPRTLSAGLQQMARYFTAGMGDQFTWLGVGIIFLGFWSVWRRDRTVALSLLAAWFLSGPFFAWLGNLSFDAQSDGVLERFYIFPAVFAAYGAGFFFDAVWRRKKIAASLLFLLPGFILARSAETYPLRGDFLAQDYARSIFRTLPPGAAFFMDGGDDTFFTTAFQQFVQRQRSDVRLFDRGGLVFKSAYGSDFRGLNKTSKEARRQSVEKSWLERGPLFYSTMNEKILDGAPLAQAGFLYGAGGGSERDFHWHLYAIRSLYPPASKDYRTLALAPYFPYLEARSLWRDGKFDEAVEFLDRAWRMGPGVPWLRNNFAAETLAFAYGRLQAGDWARAEILSRKCLDADPANITAMSNMGVVEERRGNLDRAAEWYERAIRIDPRRVQVLYNLSVVRWRQGDWKRVVPLLEQILRLEPGHELARRYLPQAQQRLVSHGG